MRITDVFHERCPHCGEELFKVDPVRSFIGLYLLKFKKPSVCCHKCKKESYRSYPLSLIFVWSKVLLIPILIILVAMIFDDNNNRTPDMFVPIVGTAILILYVFAWFGLQSRGLFPDEKGCPPLGYRRIVARIKDITQKKHMVKGFVYDIRLPDKRANAIVHLEEKGDGEYLFRIIRDDSGALTLNSDIEIITRDQTTVCAVIEKENKPV